MVVYQARKHLVKDFDLNMQLSGGLRNLLLQGIGMCTTAVVATEWQKVPFPRLYQDKLNVIFDGIDGFLKGQMKI